MDCFQMTVYWSFGSSFSDLKCAWKSQYPIGIPSRAINCAPTHAPTSLQSFFLFYRLCRTSVIQTIQWWKCPFNQLPIYLAGWNVHRMFLAWHIFQSQKHTALCGIFLLWLHILFANIEYTKTWRRAQLFFQYFLLVILCYMLSMAWLIISYSKKAYFGKRRFYFQFITKKINFIFYWNYLVRLFLLFIFASWFFHNSIRFKVNKFG